MKQEIAPFPDPELYGDLGRGHEPLVVPFNYIDNLIAEEAVNSLGRNDIEYRDPYLYAYSMNTCRLLFRCNDFEDLLMVIDAANYLIYYKRVPFDSTRFNDLKTFDVTGCARIEGSCRDNIERRVLARLEREGVKNFRAENRNK